MGDEERSGFARAACDRCGRRAAAAQIGMRMSGGGGSRYWRLPELRCCRQATGRSRRSSTRSGGRRLSAVQEPGGNSDTMRTDQPKIAPAGRPAGLVAIRVQRTLRGRWEVTVPGQRKGITCETLDEARRVAYLTVAHTRPCELIVHDAYHRVLDCELIDGNQIPPSSSAPHPEQLGPRPAVPNRTEGPRPGGTPASSSNRRRRAPPKRRRPPSVAPEQSADDQGGQ